VCYSISIAAGNYLFLKILLAMPKYPMNAKTTEIVPIASLFLIPKVRPIATIPIIPNSNVTPTFLASFLDIVAPLKPTLKLSLFLFFIFYSHNVKRLTGGAQRRPRPADGST
jgi:hypothetical protein